ncbi:MAG: hypothetical protein WDA53_04965 [Bacillota bacterium]
MLISDLFIFKFVTNKPLGLKPSDLADGPQIHLAVDAALNIPLNVDQDVPFVLVPPLDFYEIIEAEQQNFQVIGYGFAEKSLYVQVRFHQDTDLSLKKGWGKAIQLVDNRNRCFMYDSYSLPWATQLYDKLVDLPDDLRANLRVEEGCFKDLFLCFPDYPKNSVPTRLRLVESFFGNSPVNSNNVYYDLLLTDVSAMEKRQEIIAHKPFKQPLNISQPIKPLSKISLVVDTLWIDDNLLPRLTFWFSCNMEETIMVKDLLLIDQDGQSYNMFHLEENLVFTTNESKKIEVIFERIPSSAWIKEFKFVTAIDGSEINTVIRIQ